MKTLLKGGNVINVFNRKIIKANVLIENDVIVGLGEYNDKEADKVYDVSGKWICPGFIDSHIHIESTMLSPYEFAKAVLPHGTTGVVADPHEIANVCGTYGIDYMLEASKGLPLDVYIMVPSCVPATGFDESYDEIAADKIAPYFDKERVLGLAEMMNYVGVINEDPKVIAKLKLAKEKGKIIDGHAPLLTGAALDKYLSYGINSDHECSSVEEALERIDKGQWLMIRRGSAAKNLHDLLPLFDIEGSNRCVLVTDDKEPAELIKKGHIDSIINKSVRKGKSPLIGIQMATINAANCFKLKNIGAIAPGYRADILVLDDLEKVHVYDVYKNGVKVVEATKALPFAKPIVDEKLLNIVMNSMNASPISTKDLYITPSDKPARIIEALAYGLMTKEKREILDFSKNNGIDVERDILKMAVVERHKNTGHIGLGYINGISLKRGAIASTVSHDSHNIIAIGCNDEDIKVAINEIIKIGGGNVIVDGGKVVKSLPLPIGGLMSSLDCESLSKLVEETRSYVHNLGVPDNIAPFMNMAFLSLPVIPSLKLTTIGYVDVDNFKLVPLFVE